MNNVDKARRIGVRGPTIVTRSGRYFNFVEPNPATIDILDIAWGLAFTCRFAGQTLRFYSVAQHSVMVSRLVPAELSLVGLLHDAAEAYVGDVTRPLKQLIPEYRVIEDRVERAIAARFNLPWPWPSAVKHADLRMLRTEQRDLTSASGDAWASVDGYAPLAEPIIPLPADDAAGAFIDRYRELTAGGVA